MSTITNLQDLQIWQIAQRVIKRTYKYCHSLPKDEIYISEKQIKRTSRSIADNIAEAHGRYNYKDRIRFLYYSRGSLEELRSQVLTNQSLALGNIRELGIILEEISKLSVKLNNTIQSIAKRTQ